MTDAIVAPEVVAVLLLSASERGAETLVRTDRLLRELSADAVVDAGHRLWTSRLRRGLVGSDVTCPEPEVEMDTFGLLRRLRPARPGGR